MLLGKTQLFSKNYLFPAITGLVIVFVLLKFTFPQFQQIVEAQQKLKGEKDRLEQLIKKARQLEKLDEETLKNNLQTTQHTLPSEKDVAGLLFTVARLQSEATVSAEKLELTPGLISTPSATPSAGYLATPSGAKEEKKPMETKREVPQLSSLDFSVSLVGEFGGIRYFLEKIKGINPLLVTPDIKISQREGEENVRAELKILSSYQLLPMTLGKIEDPLPVLTDKDENTLSEISRLPIYSQIPSGLIQAIVGKVNPFE